MEKLPLSDVESDLAVFEGLLGEIELATQCDSCNWGLDLRSDVTLLHCPELGGLRKLGTIMALKARLEIAQGRYSDACQTLKANLVLGSHLGKGPTVSHVLTGLSICRLTTGCLDEFVQQPDAPNLYWALTSIPQELCSLDAVIFNERESVQRLFPELANLLRGPVSKGELDGLRERINEFTRSMNVEPSSAFQTMAVAGLYEASRQRLLDRGYDSSAIDRMPMEQVVIVDKLFGLRLKEDACFRWFQLSFEMANKGVEQSYKEYAQAYIELDSVLTGGILTQVSGPPDLIALRTLIGELDRRVAMLQLVESIRDSADASGSSPLRLGNLKLPTPPDPKTLLPFHLELVEDDVTVWIVPTGNLDSSRSREKLAVVRVRRSSDRNQPQRNK